MTENYLYQALELARSRRGFCAPNPSVGAVVVKGNQVIATGCHWKAGLAHAEQNALSELGQQAHGASLYVTLEPCCHWGKTPPCTDSIIENGIKDVFIGMIDPNPRVFTKAFKLLGKAGIRCQLVELPEIKAFYRSYIHYIKNKRPWVTAKLALSLDLKIAAEQGQPVQITGKELNAYTHMRRQHSDAILTTAKTLNQDNPQLNARTGEACIKKHVYVLARQLDLAEDLKIYQTAKKLTLFHGNQVSTQSISQLQDRGIECIAVDETDAGLDLEQVLNIIGQQGIHDLWVEGGGKAFTSLLNQRLINTALIYIAPKILGERAYPAFRQPPWLLEHGKAYHWQEFGKDVMCQIDFSD